MDDKIEYKRLCEVKATALIHLMNHPLVRRQMPLLKGPFDQDSCKKFIAAKESLWSEFGYGPRAIIIGGQFAGWGGLQPEDGDADLALVLHPDYWGMGRAICQQLIEQAFHHMNLPSVTILFPTTRSRIKGILKLGFVKESEVIIGEYPFIKYRLEKPLE